MYVSFRRRTKNKNGSSRGAFRKVCVQSHFPQMEVRNLCLPPLAVKVIALTPSHYCSLKLLVCPTPLLFCRVKLCILWVESNLAALTDGTKT